MCLSKFVVDMLTAENPISKQHPQIDKPEPFIGAGLVLEPVQHWLNFGIFYIYTEPLEWHL